MNQKRDLLSIADLNAQEILEILSLAKKLKQKKTKQSLSNKNLVMIFQKPSLRTKMSFDLAITQLGGHAVYFDPEEAGLGKRESVADVSKVSSSMADFIMARVFKHSDIEELAEHSKVPVINGLSDYEHPCQILADLLTILETKGKLSNLTITFIGDGYNNVSHSLALACAVLGLDFRCAAPKGYQLCPEIVKRSKELNQESGGSITLFDDPKKAIKGSDVVITDSWISMGKEEETKKRLKIFKPFQVNKALFSLAKKDAIFLHCLPAHRGYEVTPEIIDSEASKVFEEAENRLHAQKALLLFLNSYV